MVHTALGFTDNIMVRKASGEFERYKPEKVINSCVKAGASIEEAEYISKEISGILYNGISTREIYSKVHHLLERMNSFKASKFILKEALMKLGPEGFNFETFIAKILDSQRFETRLRNISRGHCVEHEIDIIAEKIEKRNILRYMVECKYHNYKGIYTGLKEAMYTHARLLDLNKGSKIDSYEKFHGAWLITNTKFSKEAIVYAKCVGLKLTGWSYPPDSSIQNLIDSKKLYPITIMRSIGKNDRKSLSSAGLIIINDLVKRSSEELLRVTGLQRKKIFKIKEEADRIIFDA